MVEQSGVAASLPSRDDNGHVKEYLAYYVSLPHPPNYAVMVKGPWGIGKTYLISEFLEQHVKQRERYVYVSLYGMTTTDDFDAALLQAIAPASAAGAAKAGARIGKTLLRSVGTDSDVNVRDVIGKFKADLFIFDDLERCSAPINKVMGYINQFVEHDGCKVIIIANEQEIVDGEYAKRREKLIGKTLEVRSSFNAAFSHFLARIDHPETKALLARCASAIAAVYRQSGLENLRILQQTIWDFDRFFRALGGRHRRNGEAAAGLLALLFALSFEVKAGRLQPDDLVARLNGPPTKPAEGGAATPPSPLAAAGQRYPDIDLNDPVLSDDLLIDILFKGIVDEIAIRSCIDASRYFVSAAEEPAWRTVWHWFERTDEEFADAFAALERQFAAREFAIPGEVLHVFGLRLFLAKIGLLKRPAGDIVADAKRYVDDLYAAKRLKPLPNLHSSDVRPNGHGGLGIFEHQSPEYQAMFGYLEETRRRATEDEYPRHGLTLLEDLASDPKLYFRRLCPAGGDDNRYGKVPILSYIDPNRFVAALLKQHPSHQRVIMTVFHARYEHGELKGELAAERTWLEVVRDKLIKRSFTMPAIGRFRLLESVMDNIDPALGIEEKA
jgi:hypothetical protein